MPLTYQPFSETPAIDRLNQDLYMNVSDHDRWFSALLGAGLAFSGLTQRGAARWACLALGGVLLYRGWSGNCAVSRELGIDGRHGTPRTRHPRGIRIEATVQVDRPAEELYRYWRDLERLPEVMTHVQKVQLLDAERSHWKVADLAGRTWEWDAQIINEHPGRLIAWQSLPGGQLDNAGSVWFEPDGQGTRLKVALDYYPPGGTLAGTIANVFGIDPQQQLQADLQRFKEFAEGQLGGA